jgi:hypothetical protein
MGYNIKKENAGTRLSRLDTRSAAIAALIAEALATTRTVRVAGAWVIVESVRPVAGTGAC